MEILHEDNFDLVSGGSTAGDVCRASVGYMSISMGVAFGSSMGGAFGGSVGGLIGASLGGYLGPRLCKALD